MIRTLRLILLVVLALCLMALALANRDPVTLRLLPEGAARFAGGNYALEVPLFAVIFGGVIAGILIGLVWEWLREHRYRAEAATQRRERERLERELRRAGRAGHAGSGGNPADEVLALIEQPASRAR